uniref:HMG box domain-containing protein n=1 Tax=Romanomermis culicivorax TaxID=13658 RepID=A0A915IR85_ROMCU
MAFSPDRPRINPNIRPPRRTRTAYVFFIQENFPKVARKFETRNPQPVIRHLAQMWRDLRIDVATEFGILRSSYHRLFVSTTLKQLPHIVKARIKRDVTNLLYDAEAGCNQSGASGYPSQAIIQPTASAALVCQSQPCMKLATSAPSLYQSQSPEKEKQRYRQRQKNDHERYINMKQKFYNAYKMRPPKLFRRGSQCASHRSRKASVLFEMEAYDQLRLGHPEWNETQIDAEMAKKWNCLEPAQRSIYIRSALNNKVEFDRRLKEYRLLKSRRALDEHMKNGLKIVEERYKQSNATNAI